LTFEDIASYATALGVALEKAVAAGLARAGEGCRALLYSAGLDSTVLAQICHDIGHAPLLLSLGTSRSRDRRFVERSRAHFNLPVEFVAVEEEDIARALPLARDLLQKADVFSGFARLDRIHLSIGVAMILACQAAEPRGITQLLTAHGADALFAGFDRYNRVPPEKLPATLERDARRAVETGLVRDRAVTDRFSIQLLTPFLEPGLVELALSVPAAFKLGPQGDKLVLRELARQRGVPEFIAARPKKSIQYSTGIWTVMQQLWQSDDS